MCVANGIAHAIFGEFLCNLRPALKVNYVVLLAHTRDQRHGVTLDDKLIKLEDFKVSLFIFQMLLKMIELLKIQLIDGLEKLQILFLDEEVLELSVKRFEQLHPLGVK